METQWQSEQINELVGAIVRAQLKLEPAKKDTLNPFFHKKYADLPTCWEAIKSFREEGVAIVQSPMEGPEGYVLLDTQLSHTSGQWMRSRLKIRVAKDDPQGYGSAITYARRYALGCMTGLVTEEDDDGNAASQPQGKSMQANKAKFDAMQQRKKPASEAPPSSGAGAEGVDSGTPEHPAPSPQSEVDALGERLARSHAKLDTPSPQYLLETSRLIDTVTKIREAAGHELNTILMEFVRSNPAKADAKTVTFEVEQRRKQLRGK
ncbi:MAG: ERF family protein [Nitrospira sp.]|nr:ERF family protein [Nitrospira sp.]